MRILLSSFLKYGSNTCVSTDTLPVEVEVGILIEVLHSLWKFYNVFFCVTDFLYAKFQRIVIS